MKVAVMQPYFLPYLGYFQLVNVADKFVFFDDVNFIMKGWINRNQVLANGTTHKFTIPLNKASQNKLIKEVRLSSYSAWRNDFIKLIELNYKRAPFYSEIHEWLKTLLFKREYELISDLASESIISASTLLGISTSFLFSSEIDYTKEQTKNGQEKVLNICKILGATEYINPQNGTDLYNKSDFSDIGVSLHFLKMSEIRYEQLKNDFIPYLSILDVLMFNNKDTIKQYLHKFSYIQA